MEYNRWRHERMMTMSVKSVSLLKLGRCQVDSSILDTRKEMGTMTNLPIWSYLVETTEGPVLIDTGMPDFCVDDQDLFRQPDGSADIVPEMTAADTIVAGLARAGYKPDDMLFVVSTHWHFDHAGGNIHFPNTDIVVQKAEYDVAMGGGDYPDICRDPNLKYKIVDGDLDIAPGIRLLLTPGHTLGHQSVLLETEKSGPILLTVDASYWRGNYEDLVPFGGADDALMKQSIAKLKDVQKATGAFVFFGHDVGQEQEVEVYPHKY